MPSQEIASAINEEDLDNFILSIMDAADDISTIFEKIDNEVSRLSEYLKSEALKNILNEYNEIKSNYAIIHDNILTYSDDLIDVKNNMKNGIKNITLKVNIFTEELQDKKKEVK